MKYRLLLLFSIISFSVSAQRTFLHCGQLIDVKTLKVLHEKTIIIEGNKIVEVEDGYTKPSSKDIVIDLKKNTVMPGLIDMHVHIESETSP